MTADLGLLLPLSQDAFAEGEQDAVEAAVTAGLVDGVWVRDLPCVPRDDADKGQAADPFAHLGFVAGRRLPLRTVGTASIILGTRHPIVIARAAAGLQHLTAGRFVLGVGTGGKPAMNRALGVDDRPMRDFARDWRALRSALRRPDYWDPAVVLPAAPDRPPPPMFLATTDLAKWRCIDGDADGWQTFASTPSDFLDRYAQVCAVRGGPTDVAVRLDATVAPSEAAPT
ncbi:MAG TPA: LLM class flavin-dependent oxidoreductase, partial [Lapillicoccus sp.]